MSLVAAPQAPCPASTAPCATRAARALRPAPLAAPHRQRWQRRSVAAAGEGRSANRAKWASGDLSGPSAAVLDGEEQADSQQAAEQQAAAAAAESTDAPLDASDLVWAAADAARPLFADIDRLVHANISRVQQAMRRQRIGPHHFAGSTGYGHGDLGRAALDDVFAEVRCC